jgi:hypothetical protein
MGTWGASLYDDDTASDLKTSVALICKVPAGGNRLLELLRQTHTGIDPDDQEGDGTLFWLVAADQFEKKGIACPEAAETALRIIDSGTSLAVCKANGADEKFLKARQKGLLELAARLRQPRPVKAPSKAGKLPPLVLETGQIYAFPTQAHRAWHPYRLDSAGPFVPDGWGALVVLATGRAFEWLPWVALAALTVNPDIKPTLADALQGKLIPHPQTNGAARFAPKPAHAKGLGLSLLGAIELDHERVRPHLSKWPVEKAIQYDWTIAYGALSSAIVGKGAEAGVVLESLRKSGS